MKQLICCLAMLCSYTYAHACNVCGSSAGNQYLGLLPQTYKNFIGLQYQQRGFVSEHPGHGEHSQSTFSREQYITTQLWGRYYIGNRLQVFAFVPFVFNTKTEAGTKKMISGLGDISLMANVNLVNSGDNFQHLLQAGAGIKVPTGAYNEAEINRNDDLPNMQPGTRSWDFSFNANYTVRRNKAGLNTDIAYTLTTPNIFDYKYGNKASIGILGFYQCILGDVTILPQCGVKADVTARDYENYTYRWNNDMTGGTQLYAAVGGQFYYKKLGFQCSYHQPLYQHFASGLVKSKFKFESGIYLLF